MHTSSETHLRRYSKKGSCFHDADCSTIVLGVKMSGKKMSGITYFEHTVLGRHSKLLWTYIKKTGIGESDTTWESTLRSLTNWLTWDEDLEDRIYLLTQFLRREKGLFSTVREQDPNLHLLCEERLWNTGDHLDFWNRMKALPTQGAGNIISSFQGCIIPLELGMDSVSTDKVQWRLLLILGVAFS